MSKNLYSLVPDIYNLMKTSSPDDSVDVEQEIEKFGEACKQLMRDKFDSKGYVDNRKLRMSNIGRDDRILWHHCQGTDKEEILPHTYIKFMYGHLIEEMLLLLVRLSGHNVTDEQKQVEVRGIKGHMDCKIDGTIIDVKSTSTYGFKKFKEGTLAMDDPFGYVAQNKGYARAEGETKYGWLAMDKQNGHLTCLVYDEEDTQAPIHEHINWDIEERIEYLKKAVVQKEPPKICQEPVPDGKSGNMKLPMKCSYCSYKKSCYPNLRAFAYSYGPRYLTKVENEPKVREIKLE